MLAALKVTVRLSGYVPPPLYVVAESQEPSTSTYRFVHLLFDMTLLLANIIFLHTVDRARSQGLLQQSWIAVLTRFLPPNNLYVFPICSSTVRHKTPMRPQANPAQQQKSSRGRPRGRPGRGDQQRRREPRDDYPRDGVRKVRKQSSPQLPGMIVRADGTHF